MIDFLKSIHRELDLCCTDLATNNEKCALIDLGILLNKIENEIKKQEGIG